MKPSDGGDSPSNMDTQTKIQRAPGRLAAAFVLSGVIVTLGGASPPARLESVNPMQAAVLSPSSFKHYIDRFNEEDEAARRSETLSIPNAKAWPFLEKNI